MLASKDAKAFRQFYDSVRDGSVLDQKTTILVGVAAALTAGCDP